MKKFIPDMYKKDIYSIDYKKLKEKYKIKVLLFDFDNTIIDHGNNKLNKKTKELFNKIKKEFIIYIVSNSFNNEKLDKICNELEVPYIGKSLKPLPFGYKRLKFKSIKNKEIATIGDQLLTDVFGSKMMGYFSILVDPVKQETEIIFTKINRKFENMILKNKKNDMKRGNYYD